jgi:hypothetical protein
MSKRRTLVISVLLALIAVLAAPTVSLAAWNGGHDPLRLQRVDMPVQPVGARHRRAPHFHAHRRKDRPQGLLT